MAIAATKSWRPLVALTVAAVFACLAARATAAEMAPTPSPSPSPASGAAGARNGQVVDEETSLTRRLLDMRHSNLDLTESEFVGLQKYMDRLEVRLGGQGFRFEKTMWELTPRELGFKLGVIFTQAAFQCTILTRVSEDPSRPTLEIPAFVREKLHLQLSGITAVPAVP